MGCDGCGKKQEKRFVGRKADRPPKVSHPTIYENKTIVFPSEAPNLPGYKRDPAFPTRLIPTSGYPCCKRRSESVVNTEAGYELDMICRHPEHPKFNQKVTLRNCHPCGIRECIHD